MESLYRVNSDKLSSKIKFDSLSSIYQFITQLRFAWHTTVSLLILFLLSADLTRPQNTFKNIVQLIIDLCLNQQINVITHNASISRIWQGIKILILYSLFIQTPFSLTCQCQPLVQCLISSKYQLLQKMFVL